jgi:hypothetical protein
MQCVCPSFFSPALTAQPVIMRAPINFFPVIASDHTSSLFRHCERPQVSRQPRKKQRAFDVFLDCHAAFQAARKDGREGVRAVMRHAWFKLFARSV